VLGRALCRGTAGTGEPDAARSHGAPLGHARRQKTLRPAQAHPRAGVRHHQVGSGLSAILAARARQGPRRVELGDHGLEHQADLRPQYPVKRAGAIAHQPKRDGGTRDHVANLFNPSDPGGRNAKRRSIPRSAKLQSDRLLEEGKAYRASDIDVMWLNGFGFPRYRGGLMYWADGIGVAEVYRQIQAWHQQYGERWAPSPLLRRLAETGTPLREAKPGRPM